MVLAALLAWFAVQVQGALAGFILLPGTGLVFFVLLAGVSVLEILVMTLTLRQVGWQLGTRVLSLAAVGYVAFAGVYAILYALLAADPRGILALASLCGVRWLTLWLLPEPKRT